MADLNTLFDLQSIKGELYGEKKKASEGYLCTEEDGKGFEQKKGTEGVWSKRSVIRHGKKN